MKSRVATHLAPLAAALLLAACSSDSPPPTSPGQIAPPAPPPPTPTPPPSLDTPEYRRSNAATQSNVLSVWAAGLSGAGVLAGIVDTGIDTASAEFAGRIHPSSRDITGAGRPLTDEDGHGTFVAGVLGAARNNASIVGIAPDASLAVMRGDRSGSCSTDKGCSFTDASVAAGVNAATDAGARVINISLGGSSGSLVLRQAFARAGAQGSILVIGAGNDGKDQIDPLPQSALQNGNRDTILVVGAATAARDIASFSNRAGTAASNFLLAPGQSIRAFDHTGAEFLVSGTSIAAPVVSGAVALMAQAFPNLTPAQIVDLLLRTADDLGAPGPDPVYGRGLLNIGRAFAPQGPTTLAATAVPVSTTTNGTLGAPLGDGTSFRMALGEVEIADGYGRRYGLLIGDTLGAPGAGRVGAALADAPVAVTGFAIRSGAVRMGFTGVRRAAVPGLPAFADPDVHLGDAQKGLGPFSARAARMGDGGLDLSLGALRLAAGTGLAAPRMPGASASPGLATPDAVAGLAQSRGLQMMVSSTLGPVELALGHRVESERLPGLPDAAGPGEARSHLAAAALARGPARLSLHMEQRDEAGTLLGTRLSPAFGLLAGTSHAAGAALDLQWGPFLLRGAFQQGWHRAEVAEGGLLAGSEGLVTRAHSASVTLPLARGAVFLSHAAPEAVAAGGFRLRDGALAPLAVGAREHAFEAGVLRGPLALSLFAREHAGNRAGLTDAGVALRLSTGF